MACSTCKKKQTTSVKSTGAKTYTVPKTKQTSGNNYVYKDGKRFIIKQS